MKIFKGEKKNTGNMFLKTEIKKIHNNMKKKKSEEIMKEKRERIECDDDSCCRPRQNKLC